MNPFELESEYRKALLGLYELSVELAQVYADDEAMREEQEKIRDYCKQQLKVRGIEV